MSLRQALLASIEQEDDIEAWRPALIAFCSRDEMRERAAGLIRGEPLDYIDKRLIRALQAAVEVAP